VLERMVLGRTKTLWGGEPWSIECTRCEKTHGQGLYPVLMV
jgi:hypothetical protein